MLKDLNELNSPDTLTLQQETAKSSASSRCFALKSVASGGSGGYAPSWVQQPLCSERGKFAWFDWSLRAIVNLAKCRKNHRIFEQLPNSSHLLLHPSCLLLFEANVTPKVTSRAFFDVAIGGKPTGRCLGCTAAQGCNVKRFWHKSFYREST